MTAGSPTPGHAGTIAGIGFDRAGSGEPLLLVHGSGGDRRIWRPVFDRLARERDVIAVDLPGHGVSAAPVSPLRPVPADYARSLAAFLTELGIERIDVVGNSAGGWTGLELARLGRARSVLAICPAGLWRGREPRTVVAKLWAGRRAARLLLPLAPTMMRGARGRRAVLSGAVGRPARMPPAEAVAMLRALALAPDFDRHLKVVKREHFTGGAAIDVPVTVAFGDRDTLLSARHCRHRDQLPAQTRWRRLPGCGHIPTWDDPDLIVAEVSLLTKT